MKTVPFVVVKKNLSWQIGSDTGVQADDSKEI